MAGQRPDDAQVKHLEFVQAVIARLANDSFLMKGWALTVAGIILGFAADNLSWRMAAAAFLPVAAFWGLDAYFLRQERLFRRLYDAVRRSDPRVEPFCMDTQDHAGEVGSWRATVVSRTLLPFYGVVLLLGVVLILVDAFRR